MPHPDQLLKKEVFKVITAEDTFATVLHAICLITYGPEMYEWDILELGLRLEDDYHAKLSDHNENRLNAIMLATSTHIFYEQTEAFQGICATLADGDPGIGLAPDLTIVDVMAAVYEVELNHGPHSFQPGVEKLIQGIMDGEQYEPEEDPEDDGRSSADYVTNALEDFREHLKEQLERVGFPNPQLPPVGAEAQPKALLTVDGQ